MMHFQGFSFFKFYSDKNYSRPTGLRLCPILHVVHNSELKLIINLELECFQAKQWESERTIQINVPVAKLIRESSQNHEHLNTR